MQAFFPWKRSEIKFRTLVCLKSSTSLWAKFPPLSILNRKLQLNTLRFGMQFPKSHWPLSFSTPKSQQFKSQCLEDANATKSQTLAFHKLQRFTATQVLRVTEPTRCASKKQRHRAGHTYILSSDCALQSSVNVYELFDGLREPQDQKSPNK